jgi:hypothetical protein
LARSSRTELKRERSKRPNKKLKEKEKMEKTSRISTKLQIRKNRSKRIPSMIQNHRMWPTSTLELQKLGGSTS